MSTKKQEQKVRFRIPVDPLNPNDLIYTVTVNGYNYKVVRGTTVELPQSVIEVIERSESEIVLADYQGKVGEINKIFSQVG